MLTRPTQPNRFATWRCVYEAEKRKGVADPQPHRYGDIPAWGYWARVREEGREGGREGGCLFIRT